MMNPIYNVCDYDPECDHDDVLEALRDAMDYANEEGQPKLVVQIVAVIHPTTAP